MASKKRKWTKPGIPTRIEEMAENAERQAAGSFYAVYAILDPTQPDPFGQFSCLPIYIGVSCGIRRRVKAPSQKLGALCAKQAGAWSLLIPAVEIPRYPRSATMRFGNEQFLVTRTDLWVLARGTPMRNASVEFSEGRGFGAMFDYRLIADRTRGVAEANASPPLGLFGCAEPSGNLKWAASIMPGHYGGNSWLYLTILPVTHDFLADIRRKNQELQQKTAKLSQDAIASAQEADRVAAAEEVRLQPWREQLKIGDQTNCGMVVDVRGPLLEMQLPPYITGPNGIRRFWVQRSQITDKPVGIGCRFGA